MGFSVFLVALVETISLAFEGYVTYNRLLPYFEADVSFQDILSSMPSFLP
jgi:hypothetical protein